MEQPQLLAADVHDFLQQAWAAELLRLPTFSAFTLPYQKVNNMLDTSPGMPKRLTRGPNPGLNRRPHRDSLPVCSHRQGIPNGV